MDLKVLCKKKLCREVGSFPTFLVLQIGIAKEFIPWDPVSYGSFREGPAPSSGLLFILELGMLRVLFLRLSPSGIDITNHHF